MLLQASRTIKGAKMKVAIFIIIFSLIDLGLIGFFAVATDDKEEDKSNDKR